MTIAREEIFGPVLCVIPYDGEDEAVAIANDSPYGLSGSVWTRGRRARRCGRRAPAHGHRSDQLADAARLPRAVRRLQAVGHRARARARGHRAVHGVPQRSSCRRAHSATRSKENPHEGSTPVLHRRPVGRAGRRRAPVHGDQSRDRGADRAHRARQRGGRRHRRRRGARARSRPSRRPRASSASTLLEAIIAAYQAALRRGRRDDLARDGRAALAREGGAGRDRSRPLHRR